MVGLKRYLKKYCLVSIMKNAEFEQELKADSRARPCGISPIWI